MPSLGKWFRVRLRTKWVWVRIPLLSLKLQIWCLLRARSSLTFRQSIECRFTLNLVHDIIITYSQMHRTDTYSQHTSIIWPVWLNDWVFVYELNGCVSESRCSLILLGLMKLKLLLQLGRINFNKFDLFFRH